MNTPRNFSRMFTPVAVATTLMSSCKEQTPVLPNPTPAIERAAASGPSRPGSVLSRAELALKPGELERATESILRAGALSAARKTEVTEPLGPVTNDRPSLDTSPPPRAAEHRRREPGAFRQVPSTRQRLGRSTPKARPSQGSPVAPPSDFARLGFAGDMREVRRGVSPKLLRLPQPNEVRRDYTYAFLVLTDYPSAVLDRELEARGARVLGPHAEALKVRVPLSQPSLDEVARLRGVKALTHMPAEQKLSLELRTALAESPDQKTLPLVVNVFDADALEETRAWLLRNQAIVGRVDRALLSVTAAVPLALVKQLSHLDTVLFVELRIPSAPGHDESIPVLGMDYVRAGGTGARYSGASTILGILDTGFMMGSLAPTAHRDLNKHGCGENFTADPVGVWHDQSGHGTHVLATAIGSGVADPRFRGVAPLVGSDASASVLAAKIWGQTGVGDEIAAYEYMMAPPNCPGRTPQVVNLSGVKTDAAQVGTDELARKVDEIVWSARQTWVVCAGNRGPAESSLTSPGLAKNALTVGDVVDAGPGVIGDTDTSSSRGPTADHRLKPNLVATGSSVRSAEAGTVDRYEDKFGCSMATPHVSGIVATVMEHFPEFRSAPQLVRAHLMATALLHDNISLPADNTTEPDAIRGAYGLGLVSPYVAHWSHPSPTTGWTVDWVTGEVSDSAGGAMDLIVPSDASRLVVVMSWDEPAASAGASRAVTNDLDLWLDRTPFCEPDERGECGDLASQSYYDNVEYLIVERPEAGAYRVKIANWHVREPLPVAVSTLIVHGSTTPAMQLSASAGPVAANGQVKVTVTVANPSWLLSGVYLESGPLPAGISLLSFATKREDDTTMEFDSPHSALSLGAIVEGDSRSVEWTFTTDGSGPKTIPFRATAENADPDETSVSVIIP
jgi:hypothetical protein